MAQGFESLPFVVILQAEAERRVAGPGHTGPGAIGTEHPRIGLVPQRVVQHPGHPSLQLGVVDGDDHLHPPVEVALHQVG